MVSLSLYLYLYIYISLSLSIQKHHPFHHQVVSLASRWTATSAAPSTGSASVCRRTSQSWRLETAEAQRSAACLERWTAIWSARWLVLAYLEMWWLGSDSQIVGNWVGYFWDQRGNERFMKIVLGCFGRVFHGVSVFGWDGHQDFNKASWLMMHTWTCVLMMFRSDPTSRFGLLHVIMTTPFWH